MSYDRSTSPSPALSTQYASATVSTTDPPTASRDINKMPSPPPDTHSLSRLQIYSTQIPKAWITPICGAGAGVASGIVTCPLDVIKTKLQAQGGFAARRGGRDSVLYDGMIGTARTIWKDEGVRGMYRGLGPMLLGYLPTWAVYLTVYDASRPFFEEHSGMSTRSLIPLVASN